MKELEDRIRQDGIVREGNVLKVDNFLNHQCDVALYDHMGAEWARLFAGRRVDKILTIEASGIGIACVAATHFGGVPVVFARKTESKNMDGEQYRANIRSYTKGREYQVIVAKRFLARGEHVLVIDDFMAMGCAMNGLLEICDEAGADRGDGHEEALVEGLAAREVARRLGEHVMSRDEVGDEVEDEGRVDAAARSEGAGEKPRLVHGHDHGEDGDGDDDPVAPPALLLVHDWLPSAR